jgi:hypothetical protein
MRDMIIAPAWQDQPERVFDRVHVSLLSLPVGVLKL